MSGEKHDSGKRRFDLVPVEGLEAVADVFTFGAGKYDEKGYLTVPDGLNRYYAATLRHLFAWAKRAERNDPESGIHHLAHAAADILILMEIEKNQVFHCVGCGGPVENARDAVCAHCAKEL